MKLDRLAAAWKIFKWNNNLAPLSTYEVLQLIEGASPITVLETNTDWSKTKMISYTLLFFLLLTMR